MRAATSTPFMLSMPNTTTKSVVDLFTIESPARTSGKRSRLEDDDPDVARQEAERLERERIAIGTRSSIANEMARQTRVHEMVRGVGPSRYATSEETTQQATGDDMQIETGARRPGMSLFDPYTIFCFILLH